MAAVRTLSVPLHHLAEERCDVVLARVLGVPDVLAVVVPALSAWNCTEIRSKWTSSNPVSPVAMAVSLRWMVLKPLRCPTRDHVARSALGDEPGRTRSNWDRPSWLPRAGGEPRSARGPPGCSSMSGSRLRLEPCHDEGQREHDGQD